MNIILLITVTFTLALAREHNKSPCLPGDDHDFVKRHILQMVPGVDKAQWSNYLKDKNLCGRVKVQSFIDAPEEEVKKICTSAGEYVYDNLCRSRSKMKVYNVASEKDCTIVNVTTAEHEVVVACDKVKGECRPVHYQANIENKRIEKGKNCV